MLGFIVQTLPKEVEWHFQHVKSKKFIVGGELRAGLKDRFVCTVEELQREVVQPQLLLLLSVILLQAKHFKLFDNLFLFIPMHDLAGYLFGPFDWEFV